MGHNNEVLSFRAGIQHAILKFLEYIAENKKIKEIEMIAQNTLRKIQNNNSALL